jgi:hypothetical protein
MAAYDDPNEALVEAGVREEGFAVSRTERAHANPSSVSDAPREDPDANGRTRYTTSDEFFRLAGKIVTEEVYVPAIARTLIVKTLTAKDVQRARDDCNERKNGRDVPRRDRDLPTMVAFYATVNNDGSQFFQRSQIDRLNTEASYAAIQPLAKVALRLAGLDDEAEEQARKKAFEHGRDDG